MALSLPFICDTTCAGDIFRQYKNTVLKLSNKIAESPSNGDPFALKAHTPDLLFRYILTKEGKTSKKESRYAIEEQDDSFDELYEQARQYETSAGYHIIWAAVMSRNAKKLKQICDKMKSSKDKPYTIKDSYSNNLLHICCFLNWIEGINILLEKYSLSSWDKRNSLGKTPMDVCEKFCNERTKRALLEHAKKGSKIYNMLSNLSMTKGKKRQKNKKDYDDYSYDNYTSEKGQKSDSTEITDKSVQKFLGYGLMFFDIFDDEHSEDVISALQQSKGKLLSAKVDRYKNNILHILTLFGKDEIIGAITEDSNSAHLKDAINSMNSLNNTPMHIAVSMNDDATVSQLLKYDNVNLCIKNASYTTPLLLAIRNYKEYKSEKPTAYEIICKLLDYGDEHGNNQLNIADMYGNTPYHFACLQLSIKIITELVKHGTNVNRRNDAGLTGGDILSNKLGNTGQRANHKPIDAEKIETIFSAIDLMSKANGRNGANNRKAAIEILGERVRTYN